MCLRARRTRRGDGVAARAFTSGAVEGRRGVPRPVRALALLAAVPRQATSRAAPQRRLLPEAAGCEAVRAHEALDLALLPWAPVAREQRLVRPVQRDVGLVRQQQKPEPRLGPAVEGALAVVHGFAAVKRRARGLDPLDRREEVRPPPIINFVQQLAHRRDVRRVQRLVALRLLRRHGRGRGRRRVVVAVFYVVPSAVICAVHHSDGVLRRL